MKSPRLARMLRLRERLHAAALRATATFDAIARELAAFPGGVVWHVCGAPRDVRDYQSFRHPDGTPSMMAGRMTLPVDPRLPDAVRLTGTAELGARCHAAYARWHRSWCRANGMLAALGCEIRARVPSHATAAMVEGAPWVRSDAFGWEPASVAVVSL